MIKKTVKYDDLEGNPVTEDLYFSYTKAEIVKMQFMTSGDVGGDLEAHLREIIKTEDRGQILKMVEEIILNAYGKKSPDGKRFIKTLQMRDEFSQGEAFSEVFMELLTNPDQLVKFIVGVMPKGLADEVAQAAGQETLDLPELSNEGNSRPATRDELLAMSQEQFEAVVGKDPMKMSKEHLVIAMQRRHTS